VIGTREGEQSPGFPLAGEDSEANIVQRAELIEYSDELKASGDSALILSYTDLAVMSAP